MEWNGVHHNPASFDEKQAKKTKTVNSLYASQTGDNEKNKEKLNQPTNERMTEVGKNMFHTHFPS